MTKDFPSYVDLSTPLQRAYTHAEVEALIERIKNGLSGLKLPHQSRVALVGENSLPYFASMMAIRRAGHVATPLHANSPAANLSRIMQDAGVTVAFADSKRVSEIPKQVKCICLERDFENFGASSAVDASTYPNDRLALLIHTSGSTGRPKGVAITEKARRAFIVANVAQKEFGPSSLGRARDMTIIATPLSHILAINMSESTFALKESFVLLPKFEPDRFIRAVSEFGVTKVSMVPSMWAMILRNRSLVESLDLNKVTHIYFSSEPLSQKAVSEAERFFPSATIENCYGISEAGPNLFGPHPKGVKRPSLSVGYPRAGLSYRLADGELEIKTPFMFKEYDRDPDLKSAAMTADGFYRTGDKFEVDANGFYFFKNRSDDMIVSGGKNIYPNEIRSVIETHPEVAECAVVAVEDEIKGQKAHAFVVRKSGASLSDEDLRKHILGIAPAHLLPKKIWFVDKLPLNSNMKTDLKKLRELAASSAIPSK